MHASLLILQIQNQRRRAAAAATVKVCRFRQAELNQVISQGHEWMCSMLHSIIDCWCSYSFGLFATLGISHPTNALLFRPNRDDGIILICSSRKKSPPAEESVNAIYRILQNGQKIQQISTNRSRLGVCTVRG